MQTHARAIGVHALAVYNALAFHADGQGQCFPSQGTLAEEIGISRPTVNKAIQTLAEAGLISVEDRTLPGRGQSAQLYTLQLHIPDVKRVYIGPPADVKNLDIGPPPDVNDVYTPCKPPLQPPVNDVYSHINKTRINENHLTTPDGAHAHEGPGGGGGFADRLHSFGFDDNQIAKTIAACNGKLTDDLLDRWQAVFDSPPKGLDSPIATMVARLTRGNTQVPALPKQHSSNGTPAKAPAPDPETQARLEQERDAMLQQFSGPPRIKL